MTDQAGSCLPELKQAVVTALLARIPNSVDYDSPTEAEDIYRADGSRVGLWWGDDADCELSVDVVTGGPQWFDEMAHPTLVVQVVGKDTDDTQYAVDVKAFNALGHLFAVLASDPTVGVALSQADYRNAYAVPESWTYTSGVDSQNMRGARLEVRLTVHSRLTLEAS